MNKDLQYAFGNVNDWLKFAEAKNAGLLTLNIASVIGILQIPDGIFSSHPELRGILVVLFCFSSILCVLSILPQTNKLFRKSKKMAGSDFIGVIDTLNHLFYGDISKLSNEQFIELFKHKYTSTVFTKADEDLICQIVVNSEIAQGKFAWFKVACWVTAISFLFAIAAVISIAFKK